MPVILVDFDNQRVAEKDATVLSEAIRDILSEATGIEDVFVYANSSQIKVKVAPVEVFVEMSAGKIESVDVLISQIKARIIDWKQKTEFPHLINLSLIPMPWKIEIGI